MVINAAQKRNYKTLVGITKPDDDFAEVEKFLNSGLIRGAILFGFETGNPKIKQIAANDVPLVLINQEDISIHKNISLVNMNDEKWAYFAIEKLVSQRHKRILYLGCSRKRLPAIRREKGAKLAVDNYKSEIETFMCKNGDFNEDIAYDIVKGIFTNDDKKPTGIFAANDLMAIGAINALKDLNVNVPQDVSVIGFDDISISKYLTPSLTTISCDFNQLAKQSVYTLIDSIENIPTKEHQELELNFVERDSLSICKDRE